MLAAARCDASLAVRLRALIDCTARAALPFASSGTIAAGSLATITHAVIRTILLARWAKVATIVFAVGAAGAGVGFVAGRREQQAGNQGQAPGASQKAPDVTPKATVVSPQDRHGEVPVTRANLHAIVSQPGMVVRQNSSYAICAVEGESVIQRILPEGSIVKKGDLICELDSKTLRTQLISQNERVQAAEVFLKAATATREQAETALKEYTAATAAPSQTVLAALRAHVEDQRASEITHEAARNVENLAAKRLERQAENGKVRAPANGIIVYANDTRAGFNNRINIANGATVRERQIIVKIPDDNSPLRVASHVPRWSLPRLRVGSKVQIHAGDGADRDRVFSGKITEIAEVADPSGPRYTGPPLHAIKVSIDDAPRDFVPGKMVRIEIDVAQLTGVLTVPADAVVFFQGKDHVAVKKEREDSIGTRSRWESERGPRSR